MFNGFLRKGRQGNQKEKRGAGYNPAMNIILALKTFWPVLLVGAIVVATIELVSRNGSLSLSSRGINAAGPVSMYRARRTVLYRTEKALFYELGRQLPAGYYVFPKMRTADIVETQNGKGYFFLRNKILPKHVDFVVCDGEFKPVLAIELNGSSRELPERAERDELMRTVFLAAGLPLEFIRVGEEYADVVREIFARHLPN